MVGGVDLAFNSGVDFDRLRPSLRNTRTALGAVGSVVVLLLQQERRLKFDSRRVP